MIVGVEGVHTWESGLVLNDRLGGMPFYRVEKIPGLRSAPDFNPTADAVPGRTGEVPRLADRLGKTITYEGTVVTRSLADLEGAYADLVAAFSGTVERRMTAAPHDDYIGDDLVTREFYARPLDAGGDESQDAPPFRSSLGYERPFSVSLRLSDPRFYDPTEVTESSDDVVAGDGLALPFMSGASGSPSGDAHEVTIDNAGTVDTDPIIKLHGPCHRPVIANLTTGRMLRFRGVAVGADEVLKIDFHRRRPAIGMTNLRQNLDPASTWWDRGEPGLVPGENVIQMRGRTLGDGSSLEVAFKAADYG